MTSQSYGPVGKEGGEFLRKTVVPRACGRGGWGGGSPRWFEAELLGVLIRDCDAVCTLEDFFGNSTVDSGRAEAKRESLREFIEKESVSEKILSSLGC